MRVPAHPCPVLGILAWCTTSFSLLFFAFSAGLSPARAQDETPIALPDLNLELRHWGVDHGLATGRVDCMAQTPDGYLWLGGKRLLARFNGQRFESFDPGALMGEAHDYITRFAVSQSGELWASSNRGGILRYRDRQFEPHPLGEVPGSLFAMTAHPDGGLVISSEHDGLASAVYRVFEDKLEPLCEGSASTARAISLAVSKDGRIWMVDIVGRLYEVTGNRGKLTGKDRPGLGHLFTNRDGSLAAVGRDGLHVYADGEWRVAREFEVPLNASVLPTDTCVDVDGNIWFSARGRGLWTIGSDGSPRQMASGRNQIPLPVTDIVASDYGVWFSNYNGLSQVRYSPFINLPPSETAPSAATVTLGEAGDGTLWVACIGSLCVRNPGDSLLELKARFSPRALLRVVGDPVEGAWFVENQGAIRRLKGGKPSIFQTEDDAERTGIIVGSGGVIWVATTRGMLRYDPERDDGFTKIEILVDGVNQRSFQHIVAGADGQPIAAAKQRGLIRLDGNSGEWVNVGPTDHPALHDLLGVHVDPGGDLWTLANHGAGIGFVGGDELLFRSSASFESLRGAPTGLAADLVGGIWIATKSNGVAHVDRESLLASMQDHTKQPEFTWFDQRHGLGSKHGPFWPDGIKRAADGRIWVATAGGVSAIDPKVWADYRAASAPPRILIEDCVADGTRLPLEISSGIEIELPVGTNWLRIDYNALDFGRPGEATFRYRLRGLSEAWVEVGGETSATLNQLPAGEYHFEVVAADRFGQWSESPAVVRLSIPPNWWQTPGFSVAVALAIGLLIISIYLLRVRHLKFERGRQYEMSRQLINTQESERQRIAAELHDGLGQNLTIVKNRLTMVGQNGQTAEKDLDSISSLVSDTLNDARRMSHALRPYVLDRLGLTQAIEVIVRETSEGSGMSIDCHCDNIDGKLSRENEINLYRVIQESLNNVLKHADASHARVAIRLRDDRIQVVVEDDGRGFDPHRDPDPRAAIGGIGLPGIRERARIMGGAVEWKSARREGTKMQLEIPTQEI